jgi:hypothetical protein
MLVLDDKEEAFWTVSFWVAAASMDERALLCCVGRSSTPTEADVKMFGVRTEYDTKICKAQHASRQRIDSLKPSIPRPLTKLRLNFTFILRRKEQRHRMKQTDARRRAR